MHYGGAAARTCRCPSPIACTAFDHATRCWRSFSVIATEAVTPCLLSGDSLKCVSDPLLGVIEFEPEPMFRARLRQSDQPCVRPGPVPSALKVPAPFVPHGIGRRVQNLPSHSRCSGRQRVEQFLLAVQQEGQLRVVYGLLPGGRIGRRVALLDGDLHLR